MSFFKPYLNFFNAKKSKLRVDDLKFNLGFLKNVSVDDGWANYNKDMRDITFELIVNGAPKTRYAKIAKSSYDVDFLQQVFGIDKKEFIEFGITDEVMSLKGDKEKKNQQSYEPTWKL